MSLASVKQSIPLRPRTLDRAEYERYQPLVRRIAMRLARRVPKTISMSDLVSCGWLGLMEAFTRAAPEMPGEEFEAYASYRIRGAMLDYLRSLDSATREMRRTSRRLARTLKDLQRSLGRAPTEDETARAMGVTPAEYQNVLTRVATAGMSRLELMDFDQSEIESHSQPVDDEVSRREVASLLSQAITTLPPRLQQVLALYYQKECTLKEIGAVLGVTESRVSQLHTEAVHRLRASMGRE
jgi:RNA polymerase sigma factor for flagellar operon FliA